MILAILNKYIKAWNDTVSIIMISRIYRPTG
jgi:hypothetical protein